jgi:hypothetical protein
VGYFSYACSQQFASAASVRAWLVTTPFTLGLPWHFDWCVFQSDDDGIMVFVFEEDWIDSEGSTSHAQNRAEV